MTKKLNVSEIEEIKAKTKVMYKKEDNHSEYYFGLDGAATDDGSIGFELVSYEEFEDFFQKFKAEGLLSQFDFPIRLSDRVIEIKFSPSSNSYGEGRYYWVDVLTFEEIVGLDEHFIGEYSETLVKGIEGESIIKRTFLSGFSQLWQEVKGTLRLIKNGVYQITKE